MLLIYFWMMKMKKQEIAVENYMIEAICIFCIVSRFDIAFLFGSEILRQYCFNNDHLPLVKIHDISMYKRVWVDYMCFSMYEEWSRKEIWIVVKLVNFWIPENWRNSMKETGCFQFIDNLSDILDFRLVILSCRLSCLISTHSS